MHSHTARKLLEFVSSQEWCMVKARIGEEADELLRRIAASAKDPNKPHQMSLVEANQFRQSADVVESVIRLLVQEKSE